MFPVAIFSSLLFAMPNLMEATSNNNRAKAVGEALFQYDSATAIGSDLMTENWKNHGKYTLTGYITVKDFEGWRVLYIGEIDGIPKGYFESKLRGVGGKPDTGVEYSSPRNLSALESHMYSAKKKAGEAEIKLWCSNNYNSILIPNDKNWSVYLLAATSQPGMIVIGGHHRVDVDSTGKKILNTEQISNSCFELDASLSQGGKPSLAFTYLRGRYPNEIHYYLSRLHGIGFYVSIDTDIWFLTKGSIVYMGDLENFKRKQ